MSINLKSRLLLTLLFGSILLFFACDDRTPTETNTPVDFEDISSVTVTSDLDNDLFIYEGESLTTNVSVTVLRGDNTGYSKVPVNFSLPNETEGQLSDSQVETNNNGIAVTSYTIPQNLDSDYNGSTINIDLEGNDDFNTNLELSVLHYNEELLGKIGELNVWADNSTLSILDNNETYYDTLYARVLDTTGVVLSDIIVSFEKTSGTGSISSENAVTNEDGIAYVVYSSQAGIDANGNVDFEISIPETELSEQLTIQLSSEVYYPEDEVADLVIDLSPSTLLMDSNEIDSTYSINVTAYAVDNTGSGLQDVPIYFENVTLGIGHLEATSPTLTDENGVASAIFKVSLDDVPSYFSEAIIQASIEDPDNEGVYIAQDEATTQLITNEYAQIQLVSNLTTWTVASEEVFDNVNIAITDTVFARVSNAQGGAVENVPIQISIDNLDAGYLDSTTVFSDATGLAKTVFHANPNLSSSDVTFTIEVPATENLNEQITLTFNSANNQDPELNVSEFHFNPNNDELNYVLEEETEIQIIAKNSAGVGICNVPVHFELLPTRDSFGVLNATLVNTCDEEEVVEDTTSTDRANEGIAKVTYTNIEGGFDILHAFILDPTNGSILFEDELNINTGTSDFWELQNVTSMDAWPSTPQLNVTTLDSTYKDTIFAVARDELGGAIPGVLFEFDIDDESLGFLSNSSAVADSSGIARTMYTSLPGIVDTTINISVSIPGTELSSSNVEIRVIDNLPECPECVPELMLTSDYYTLPAGDENEIVIANISATMVDSLGNIPEVNTGIEFRAEQQDENGDWNDIGSIEPFSTFDEVGFAYTVFSMDNSSGIANIIGSANGLSDTLQIWLNSTGASYVEIVEPYPNEIMVQGGGGLESTQVTAHVRDGNGNLVSDPYWVQFEISQPAPAGTHLNGDNASIVEVIESSNGQASVTLNAGSDPGSVRMRIEVYEYEDVDLITEIASAEDIPVTIVTGPPNSGEINYSYVDITSIGGGLYEVPVSVMLVDLHSNPVSDSTNVYFWMEWQNDAYDETVQYVVDDVVKWGTTETDSLSFVCIEDLIIAGIPPTVTTYWEALDPPAQIEGEAKTGMENSTSESFPGVAWTNVIYSSGNIFANTVLKAQTYNSDGEFLIVDSRDTHGGAPLLLPFQPGQIAVSSTSNFWDFSIFGSPTDVITITATLTDYYQYPIDLGRLQLTAPGADILDDVTQYTDENGQVTWDIQYTDAVTPPTGVDPPISYQDFTSTIVVTLLDPLQTSSDPLDILLIKSQIDE